MADGMTTEPDYAQARVKMVDGQVRTTDVTELRLLDALLTVPRERFVAHAQRPLAYIDEDVRVTAPGTPPRYLIKPSPFAKLVQMAAVSPTDFVLDVGCATGYSSAVLSKLASSVVALESDAELAARATETLGALGFDTVAVVQGPLQAGYQAEAPYDVIVIGGAVEELPVALFDQLREGGRLVVVEGVGNAGRGRLYVKAEGVVTGRSVFNVAIKPLPGFERAYTFQF